MKRSFFFKRVIESIFILLVATIIIGCGGGGGSGGDTPGISGGDGDGGGDTSGINYTGVTTQAVIDEENAYDLAVTVYEGGNIANNLNVFGVIQEKSKPINTPFPLSIYNYFKHVSYEIASSAILRETYWGAIVSESETIYGGCGGSFSISINANDQTGDFTGSVIFNNYCETEFIANGSTNVSGNINPNTEEISNINMSFNNMSVAVEGESVALNGSINLNFTSYPYRMTLSFVFKDNARNDTYKFQDFVFKIYEEYDFVDIDISGRLYASDYGYVDISTLVPLRIYEYNLWPSSGTFVFTGDNGIADGYTKARLIVIDSSSFIVEADTDGDGSFDDYSSGTMSWADAL